MNQTENSVVFRKTVELCQTILDQPEYGALRRRLEAFQGDEGVQGQYRELNEQGSMLQEKQRMGLTLEEAEVAEFERRREVFLQNPVAREFLEAQQRMHEVREMVNRYVSRTFELGRMPTPEDFHSCGHGCSCG